MMWMIGRFFVGSCNEYAPKCLTNWDSQWSMRRRKKQVKIVIDILFGEACKRKTIKRKRKIQKNKKFDLKLINYFYIIFQNYLIFL